MTYKTHLPYLVKMFLLIPTVTTVKGTTKKVYPEYTAGLKFSCSFRTFGGTEKEEDDLLVVYDTATIETRYRPDITSDCRISDVNGKIYEILGTPENIEGRNKFLKFKVKSIQGGA